MLHKQVRARGSAGAVINVPKEYIGQKCLVLLALYDDPDEQQRWFDAVTGRARLPGYIPPGSQGQNQQQNQQNNQQRYNDPYNNQYNRY